MSALLPDWLGAVAAAVFVVIALRHVRHTVATAGQRRAWHACHVLMALGMACMYAPAWLDPGSIPAGFWRLALAAAGLLAAIWALGGSGERVNPVWLLTVVDLAAMVYMFSGDSGGPAVNWIVVAYLAADGAMWVLDTHRRLESADRSLLAWLPGAGADAVTSEPTVAVRLMRALPGVSLLGDLDISPSMAVMAFGMAYMVIAMQLG